ncbi:T9SS type A sorting domain-containing protein [Hymenobacter ruricola]|uniref:T9SS type A sorting domain-containing protein n=1 Tax=Hymenobacter ruricola TaxID=2791023 RepID=A0ABS0I0S7_9BACT|nr:T9SS type A sorting domain-containing protein [Hymenobacter ruricola]MBF9220555.1 T9SS type A sorting domain-containing protein [Hymenobacter ruricola]
MSRVDSLGAIKWTQYYTFNGQSVGGYLLGLPDDGAIAVGAILRQVTSSVFASVAVTSRFDSLGNVGQQRIIGRTYSTVNRVATLPDGTYALAGYEERQVPGSGTVRADGWLLRLTANGDTLGGRYFGTPSQTEFWQDVRAAPHNGLLLTGGASPGNNRSQGWLMELDSLGQVRWQQRIPASFGPTTPNYALQHGRPLQNGDVLVSGYRLLPGSLTQTQDTYQAVYRPDGVGGATAVWERIIPISANEPYTGSLDLSAAGEVTITGQVYPPPNTVPANQLLSHLRLQLTERPYVPDLCQTPPQLALGFAPTAGGDSLRFVGLPTPGPRYAQVVRWRWDFGDGTSFDGPAPPPHRYAPGQGAGTAVRLTITNNLGCTASAVAFPFALATAAQRALQAGLGVFPNPAPAGGAAVTVQLPGLHAQPPVAAELCNALGQVVRRDHWAPAQLAQGAPLPLGGLAPGVYALRLRAAEGTLVKRLVVQ